MIFDVLVEAAVEPLEARRQPAACRRPRYRRKPFRTWSRFGDVAKRSTKSESDTVYGERSALVGAVGLNGGMTPFAVQAGIATVDIERVPSARNHRITGPSFSLARTRPFTSSSHAFKSALVLDRAAGERDVLGLRLQQLRRRRRRVVEPGRQGVADRPQLAQLRVPEGVEDFLGRSHGDLRHLPDAARAEDFVPLRLGDLLPASAMSVSAVSRAS